ncbi:MAG: hypothetical protein ACYTF1_26105, partial [Planctomycetota bacterium]
MWKCALAIVNCVALAGSGWGPIEMVVIDDLLRQRGIRHSTFGPTGKRIFTERLDAGFGIRGQFSYIHYANISDPIILTLRVRDQQIPFKVKQIDWYPSHVAVCYTVGSLSVVEQKFIADDDTLVDLVTFTNETSEPFECVLGLSSGFAGDKLERYLVGEGNFYGVRAYGLLTGSGFGHDTNAESLRRNIKLKPAESVIIPVVMSMNEDLVIAERTARAWLTRPDALEHHRETYQAWFDDNCPQFECDDPFITKMYWYRWFVARHCLSRAAAGNLSDPYFFEGTHQRHFSRLITFSSPHIISEVRWLRDSKYVFGQVRNHYRNIDDKHRYFVSARINSRGGEYNNWIVKSAWEAFWVHPDKDWLGEVIEVLAGDVIGTFQKCDRDGDRLCTPKNHWTTGMEFQPAFFYFNNHDNTKPDTPLERGDFVAYTYGNARALAEAYRF